MEKMTGSIAGFFYSLWNVTIYQDETPVTPVIPSLYFPPP